MRGGGGGNDKFLNAKDLPEDKMSYFRALVPHPNVQKAWGNVVTVPQVKWMFKNGEKWLASTSEESLGRDRKDSVVQWLKAQGLEKEQGFGLPLGDSGKRSPRVKAWNALFKGKYDKDGTTYLLKPNRDRDNLICVVPVEKDTKDGYSIPRGAPVLLSVPPKLAKALAAENLAGDESFYNVEQGIDFYIMPTKGRGDFLEYTVGIRVKNTVTELKDWEELQDEVIDIMEELLKGCKPGEVINFLADALDYELPDDEEEEDEDEDEDDDRDEEEEDADEPDEEEEEVKPKGRKTPSFDAGKAGKAGEAKAKPKRPRADLD